MKVGCRVRRGAQGEYDFEEYDFVEYDDRKIREEEQQASNQGLLGASMVENVRQELLSNARSRKRRT
eukprot:6495035-Prorocentrum_lima.AAC.1